jgi:hypothetical protein
MSQRGGAVSHELITATALSREAIETQGQVDSSTSMGQMRRSLATPRTGSIRTPPTALDNQREFHTIACNSRVAYVR